MSQIPLAKSDDIIPLENSLYSFDLPNIIQNLNKKIKFAQEFDKSKVSYLDDFQPHQFIKDAIKDYVQLHDVNGKSNITVDCYSQLFTWFTAVSKFELWALSGNNVSPKNKIIFYFYFFIFTLTFLKSIY